MFHWWLLLWVRSPLQPLHPHMQLYDIKQIKISINFKIQRSFPNLWPDVLIFFYSASSHSSLPSLYHLCYTAGPSNSAHILLYSSFFYLVCCPQFPAHYSSTRFLLAFTQSFPSFIVFVDAFTFTSTFLNFSLSTSLYFSFSPFPTELFLQACTL